MADATRKRKAPHDEDEHGRSHPPTKYPRLKNKMTDILQAQYYRKELWGTLWGERKLHRYRVQGLLQQGGSAKLKKAQKDGQDYALKVMKKHKRDGKLCDRRALVATRELRALRALSASPFVVKMHDALQTSTETVLVLDLAEGDLFDTTFGRRESLSEDVIRFYLVETVLALEAVHQENIVHRDIKTENLLVARDGHIQLADFGLCMHLSDEKDPRETNLVGTREYIAPEVLSQQWREEECEFARDWYAVGVLGLQMFLGDRHFPYGGPERRPGEQRGSLWRLDEKRSALKERFIRAMQIGTPDIPDHSCSGRQMSPELRGLLTQLLTVRCSERLGCRGASEIKDHPFFKDVNWEEAAQKKLTPPSAD